MIYVLLITFGFLCVFLPKSRSLSFCGFLLFWLLWGWNTWNGDYEAYEQIFYDIGRYGLDASASEFGFNVLNLLFFKLGFDFQGFMMIYSFLTLILIFLFVRKTSFPAVFTLFYFVIFVMSYVFLRNYFADALFLHFVILSISDVTKRKKIIASLAIFFIALLFHNTSILFFSFLIVFIDRVTTKKLYLITIGIVGVIFILINFILSFISNPTILSKIQYYQQDVNPIGPAVAHFIVALAISFFLFFNKHHANTKSSRERQMLYMLERINIVSLIYIPLYFIIPDFSRFFKILFTINIFFLLELFLLYRPLAKKILLSVLFIAIYSILLYQFSFSTLKFTLYPLFKSNLIFTN